LDLVLDLGTDAATVGGGMPNLAALLLDPTRPLAIGAAVGTGGGCLSTTGEGGGSSTFSTTRRAAS
jgi:hypothetical protein